MLCSDYSQPGKYIKRVFRILELRSNPFPLSWPHSHFTLVSYVGLGIVNTYLLTYLLSFLSCHVNTWHRTNQVSLSVNN